MTIIKDKRHKTIIGSGLICISILCMLWVVVGGVLPIYNGDSVKIEQRMYILESQHVGNIMANGVPYENVLIFDVKPFDGKYIGGDMQLYFAKENTLRSDLSDGDIIVVTWHKPYFGTPYIRGVEKL